MSKARKHRKGKAMKLDRSETGEMFLDREAANLGAALRTYAIAEKSELITALQTDDTAQIAAWQQAVAEAEAAEDAANAPAIAELEAAVGRARIALQKNTSRAAYGRLVRELDNAKRALRLAR
jgi:hypothetical protein